jgi:hypothetical protein
MLEDDPIKQSQMRPPKFWTSTASSNPPAFVAPHSKTDSVTASAGMKRSGAWILPSRARPHNIERLIKAWKETRAATPCALVIDADDPFFAGYMALERRLPEGWDIEVSTGGTPLDILNRYFEKKPDLAWYGLFSDDMVPETDEWDKVLTQAAVPDFIAYPDDGIQGENLPTTAVVGGQLARKIGYLALPGLKRLFHDAWLKTYGEHRKCLKYCGDVKVWHYHFSNGKAPVDDTYRKPSAGKDKEIYEKWRSSFEWADANDQQR